MNTNEKQIALSVLEGLREDLTYVRLNNGSRAPEAVDLRQYIYALTGLPMKVVRIEQMGRMKTNALVMDGLYGNDNGHGQDLSKSSGHNGKAHPIETIWRERIEDRG